MIGFVVSLMVWIFLGLWGKLFIPRENAMPRLDGRNTRLFTISLIIIGIMILKSSISDERYFIKPSIILLIFWTITFFWVSVVQRKLFVYEKK